MAAQADFTIQPRIQNAECALVYHGTIRRADITVAIKNGLTVPFKIIGREGILYKPAPFLQKLMVQGLNDIARAALPGGDTAGLLLRAARYRTLRQAILISARAPRNKAAAWLKAQTPVGLHEKTIARLITQIQTALAHITSKPRRDGFMIGSVLCALAHGLYVQGFTLAQNIIHNLYGLMALDVVALGLGAAMIWIVTQSHAQRALHTKLGKILPKDFKLSAAQNHSRSAVIFGILTITVSAVVFIVFNELRLIQNADATFGYTILRSALF
jgi:hypothetical protein